MYAATGEGTMGTGIIAGLWMVGILRSIAPMAADTPGVRLDAAGLARRLAAAPEADRAARGETREQQRQGGKTQQGTGHRVHRSVHRH